MERLIYIGPDLIFNFLGTRVSQDTTIYDACVKAGSIKFLVVIKFEKVCTTAKEGGPVECIMGLSISGIDGPPESPSAINKAINILTVNSKQAGEVCCQAFLNNFLDAEF